MYHGMCQVKYFALIVAASVIVQISDYQTVYTQELNAINQIEGRFVTPFESRLRGSSFGLNQLERAILARETQREIQNEIVRENQEQRLQEIVKERVFESTLPIEEAARVARSIIHGQTHGQLSTFLTENTAFDQSLVGTPVSSVELFVEDCGLGSGDLLVVGTELNARNLQNEYSKATLLVQGNQKSLCERCMEQGLEYSLSCVGCNQEPWIHKSEVVLVGHLQKLDTLSEDFIVAKQCIKRIHPEMEMIEKVIPQRFGVWKFKVDSGVHLVDHMHKFVGWIPVDKYKTVIIEQIDDAQIGQKNFPIQWRRQLEYPFRTAGSAIEREMISELKNAELESMYRNGFGISPLRRKIWQMRNMRQSIPLSTQFPQFTQYPTQYSNGLIDEYSLMKEPMVGVSIPREYVGVNTVSTL